MFGFSVNNFAVSGGDLRDNTIRSINYYTSEYVINHSKNNLDKFNKVENDSNRRLHEHSYTQSEDFSM